MMNLADADAVMVGLDGLGALERELMRAILTGDALWADVGRVPGGMRSGRVLHARGLIVLWPDHPEGLHATLDALAAERMGVVADERPRLSWTSEGESGESLALVTLSECDRWVTLGQYRQRRNYIMPQCRRMAPLPFPDRVIDRKAIPMAEPDPDHPRFPDLPARIEALARAARAARKGKRARKKKARKKAPRLAAAR